MHKIFLLAGTLAILNTHCGTQSANGSTGEKNDSILPPVETRDPNTNYKPAFEGQTRVKGVKTTTSYQSKIITKDLNRPWGIAVLPDGRFLITEKGGTMRIASVDGTLSAP